MKRVVNGREMDIPREELAKLEEVWNSPKVQPQQAASLDERIADIEKRLDKLEKK